jgi:MraZ protein
MWHAMTFIGSSQHSIDAKNRLAIPSKFRSRMDPERDGTGFVIVRGQPTDRLWLYPERYFEALAGRARSGLIPDSDQLRYEQLYFSAAEPAELDSQGRILIPERMLRKAGLGKEVVICGARDHLEIRRPEDFEKELEEGWPLCLEYQEKARAAYEDVRRQAGPAAG